MLDLNDLYYFCMVVRHQGFAAAGRASGIPKSKLSRRIAQLESQLGTRLIERSTRHFRITNIGQSFFQEAQAALTATERAETIVASSLNEPKGLVRCSCPTGLIEMISPLAIDFMTIYPKASVQIIPADRPVDLIKERIDVAIRVRTKLDTDAGLTMRTLGKSHRILVASPSLVNTIGSVGIDDLVNIPTIGTSTDTEETVWILKDLDGRAHRHNHTPRFSCDDFIAVRNAAISGLGIALLPDHTCNAALESGGLVRVLPEWRSETGIVHLVFTTRVGLPPLTRVWIDQLAQGFRSMNDF